MDTNKIREVEYGVLDRHYEGYELVRLPEDLAITRLLKARGDFDRDVSRGAFPTTGASSLYNLHAFANILSRGMSHCLRWVCAACPVGKSFHGHDWKREGEQAVELLKWGVEYSLVATQHVAWSNSLIEATVDHAQRIIVFRPPLNMDFEYYKRMVRADLEWWTEELVEGFPGKSFVAIFNDWQRHAEWKPTHLEFSPDFLRRHRGFPDMRSWMTRILFPELPEDCSLGTYRILRELFTTLYTICECIRTLEDEVDRRVGPENAMGTWTFQLPRPEFIEWLTRASEMAAELVDSIVADLTIDLRRFHCSIAATPFIHSRSNTLFLLPRSFGLLSPQRSFASALTSGSGRKAYERIAGILEQHQLGEISRKLRNHGLNVVCEKSFVTPEGERLTPDLIVSDSSSCDVVIVDYKNSLAATAVAEVTNRLREYTKGVQQVQRYMDRFRQFPHLLERVLPTSRVAKEILGLLLFRQPMPLPVTKDPMVHIDDWFSARRRLGNLQHAHARDLLPPASSVPFSGAGSFMTRDIRVGDWTYRYSRIFWPDEPQEANKGA